MYCNIRIRATIQKVRDDMEFDISKAVEKIVMQVQENQEEFIFETIRPYCENILQMKINKEELKQILLNSMQKQQPCDDCISRTDALNAFKPKGISEELWMESNTYKVLTKLPSVTPKAQWIPCGERLPDTDDKVLCWYEYYHWSREKVLPEYGIGGYLRETSAWFGEVANGRDVRVIAWMPLPKGYKPEQAQPHMMCEED